MGLSPPQLEFDLDVDFNLLLHMKAIKEALLMMISISKLISPNWAAFLLGQPALDCSVIDAGEHHLLSQPPEISWKTVRAPEMCDSKGMLYRKGTDTKSRIRSLQMQQHKISIKCVS